MCCGRGRREAHMLVEDFSLTSLQVTSSSPLCLMMRRTSEQSESGRKPWAIREKKAASGKTPKPKSPKAAPLTFDSADALTWLEVADSVLLLSGWPFFAERFRVSRWISAYLTSHFEVEALAQAVHSNVSLVPRSYECDCRLLLWGEMFWFRRRIAESDLRI